MSCPRGGLLKKIFKIQTLERHLHERCTRDHEIVTRVECIVIPVPKSQEALKEPIEYHQILNVIVCLNVESPADISLDDCSRIGFQIVSEIKDELFTIFFLFGVVVRFRYKMNDIFRHFLDLTYYRSTLKREAFSQPKDIFLKADHAELREADQVDLEGYRA